MKVYYKKQIVFCQITVESPQAFKNRPKDAPLFVIWYFKGGASQHWTFVFRNVKC